ncbi:MAG: hypothetical protein ACFWTZ_04210 [Burkholderia sp.]|jgi:colicin import membrane protein
MNRSCAAALIVCGLLSGAACQAEETQAGALTIEQRGEAADKVLNDTSFADRWGAKGAIPSAEVAEKVKKEGEDLEKAVDRAFAEKKRVCTEKFLVNRCVEKARRAAFQRKKEIRAVVVTADDMIRAKRTQDLEKKRAEQRADVTIPADMAGSAGDSGASSAPHKTGHIGQTAEDVERNNARAAERRSREAANVKAYEKKQKEAAERAAKVPKPTAHIGLTAEEAAKKGSAAEAAKAEEGANQKAFDEKQAEAADRRSKADEDAAARRKKRLDRQKNAQENLKQREEAQQRYEQEKKEHKSGLEAYF